MVKLISGRAFHVVATAIIVSAGTLAVAGHWHEIKKADANATLFMQQHFPHVAKAAKAIGDKFRSRPARDDHGVQP